MTREDNEDAKFLDAADMEHMKTTRCRLFAVGCCLRRARARSLSFLQTLSHARGGRRQNLDTIKDTTGTVTLTKIQRQKDS
jgi:hypothetical protein